MTGARRSTAARASISAGVSGSRRRLRSGLPLVSAGAAATGALTSFSGCTAGVLAADFGAAACFAALPRAGVAALPLGAAAGCAALAGFGARFAGVAFFEADLAD